MRPLILLSAIALAGCAAKTSVDPRPVASSTFDAYGCDKLAEISHNLKVRSEDLKAWLQRTPAFSAGELKKDYALLRGQYFAVQEAQIDKDCPANVPTLQSAGTTAGAPAITVAAEAGGAASGGSAGDSSPK